MRAQTGNTIGAKIGAQARKPAKTAPKVSVMPSAAPEAPANKVEAPKPAAQVIRPIELKSDDELKALAFREAQIAQQAASPEGLPLGRLDGPPGNNASAKAQYPSQAPPLPVSPETVEQGWLRASGLDVNGWLDADEPERRMRLEAIAITTATGLSTVQRESLLQRIDAMAAETTGRPQPVYRGVPLAEGELPPEETLAGPRAERLVVAVQEAGPGLAAGQAGPTSPYEAPSTGPYVPGEIPAQDRPIDKAAVVAAVAGLGVVMIADNFLDTPDPLSTRKTRSNPSTVEARENPTKKKAKSKGFFGTIKSWFSSDEKPSKKRKKSQGKKAKGKKASA